MEGKKEEGGRKGGKPSLFELDENAYSSSDEGEKHSE